MRKTLLLVFIHGFKGTDSTFNNFPKDVRALLSHTLPKITILSLVYPQYETRGDLKACVARFKEWLQNKVIDLEIANRENNDGSAGSPTIDPSVHVVLCGHSMGGIVAAEALLSIARDEPVPGFEGAANSTNATNSTTTAPDPSARAANLPTPRQDDRPSSAPPPEEAAAAAKQFFFPYIEAIIAFDTPYLGISPGVLAHGAEVQLNHATTAYKAYDTASQFFGWGSSKAASSSSSAAAAAAAEAASTSWSKWGTYAVVGGAAATIAGIAGAAYLNWNQINQGLAWAGSHLEFVGCLARGAELQRRVEGVVAQTRARRVGFVNFYGALGEKVTNQTKYAGAVLGADRTFCVVPREKNSVVGAAAGGSKRNAPGAAGAATPPPQKKRGPMTSADPAVAQDVAEGEKVQAFAQDVTKSKGHWIRCVNHAAPDEIAAHTSMFAPDANPDYHDMLARARDQIAEWVDREWYESAAGGTPGQPEAEEVD